MIIANCHSMEITHMISRVTISAIILTSLKDWPNILEIKIFGLETIMSSPALHFGRVPNEHKTDV